MRSVVFAVVAFLSLLAVGTTGLGDNGDQAAKVPALVKRLKDKDAGYRAFSAFALGQIGPAAKDAVPALVEALQDVSPNVRLSSAYALGQIGLASSQAVPALIETLKDENRLVRSSVATALGKIGPAAKQALPELLNTALRDQDGNVRELATVSIEQMDAVASEAVEFFVKALQGF